MTKVSIEIHRSWGDCECCGMYDSSHATVSFEDGSRLQADREGHLGGGNWSGDAETLMLWALARLGYSVRINDTDCPVPPYYVNNYDKGYRDPVEEPVHTGPLVPLQIHVAYQDGVTDPSECDICDIVSITVPAVGSMVESKVFRMEYEADGQTPTPDSWNGGWPAVYQCLLEAVSDLTLVQTEPAETDDEADEAETESV